MQTVLSFLLGRVGKIIVTTTRNLVRSGQLGMPFHGC